MKKYIIECVGNWYFNGFELHPVKLKTEIQIESISVEDIERNLTKLFPDFFSGILDFKVTVLEFIETKEKRNNKMYIKTESEIEVIREFDNFEFEFL